MTDFTKDIQLLLKIFSVIILCFAEVGMIIAFRFEKWRLGGTCIVFASAFLVLITNFL